MRKKKSILFSCLIASAIAWPSASFGWGQDGHEIIGATARGLLGSWNVALGRRFDAILDMAHDALLTRAVDRAGRVHECHGRNIREVASWPDCVRDFPGYSSTAEFHYYDVPLCEGVPPAPALPPPIPSPPYCLNGACASVQIYVFALQLRAPGSTPRQRAEALAWIIHLAGDLHQPLHDENYNDRGGNFVRIAAAPDANPGFNQPSDNLHSFWDKDLVFAATHIRDGMTVQSIAVQGQRTWRDTDVHQWVVSAHAIAQRAYDVLPAPAYCPARNGQTGPSNGGVIAASYVATFSGTVREQLAQASVHLANILERVLA